MKKIISLSLFIGFLLCRFVSVADAQGRLRTVQEAPLHENAPIVVVTRALGDKTFDSNSRVLADQDWLKQLTFDVKNVSNKNIVYFHIDLTIPKRGKMPGAFGLAIFFGNRIAPARAGSAAPDIKEKFLRPGEIVKVKLSDDEISFWRKELEKYGAEDIEWITLDIRTVHFDDGRGWQLGIELRQDPDNPKRWLPSAKPKRNNADATFISVDGNICSYTTDELFWQLRGVFHSGKRPESFRSRPHAAPTSVWLLERQRRLEQLVRWLHGPS